MTFNLWLEYFLRFSHLVAGISWIGSSFYFIWMDSSFLPPENPRHHVDGEVFMVHGGFYYQVEKRKIYPGELPKTLHWFKWEATLTWVTGFMLLVVLYFLHGASLLIDPQVRALSQGGAIALSLALLAGSWLLYDLIWHPNLVNSSGAKKVSTLLSAVFFAGLVFMLTRIFSGRGAFIMTGAILGSLMLLNVWIRILPGQAKMLKDAQDGKVPDYSVSLKSKTRSVHNTYFIFPVLFIMLSNHYPTLYSHPLNWLLLIMLGVSGALTRHAMVTKKPVERWTLLPAAVLVGLLIWMSGSTQPDVLDDGHLVAFSQVQSIVQSRCTTCHSAHPTDDIFKIAPKGVIFETEADLRSRADKIYLNVVLAKIMPLINKTRMTDIERATIHRWLKQERLIPAP